MIIDAMTRRQRPPTSTWQALMVRLHEKAASALERMVERRFVTPGRLDAGAIRRVLVIQLEGGVNGILRMTPLLAEFGNRFPGALVDVLAREKTAETILQGIRPVRNVLQRSLERRSWPRVVLLLLRLRRAHYDLVIDLGSARSVGRIALLVTATRQAIGMGTQDTDAWRLVMFSAPRHEAKLPVFLLRRALMRDEQIDETGYPSMGLHLSACEREAGARRLRELVKAADPEGRSRRVGVILDRAGPPGRGDWWPRFVVAIRTSYPDLELAEIVTDADARHQHGNVLHCSWQYPRESLAAMGELAGIIVADLAWLDFASAAGVAVVALHVAADPAAYTPYGPQSRGINIEMRSPDSAAALAVDFINASSMPERARPAQSAFQSTQPRIGMVAWARGTGTTTGRAPVRAGTSGGQLPATKAGMAIAIATFFRSPFARSSTTRALRNRSIALRWLLGLPLAIAALPVHAGGPFGIDHVVAYDNSGIWKRNYQTDLAVGTAAFVIGGALWFGDDDEFGDTLWRSVDATALSAVATTGMKFVFSRERPSQTTDPDRFFTGHGNQSFPSGEVAEITSAVTPLMLRYGPDHPAVYALALLPLYDAIARVKVHGHWQSDVIVGAAIGAGLGYYANSRDHPFFVSILPGGFSVGLRKTFQ